MLKLGLQAETNELRWKPSVVRRKRLMKRIK